jgi:uncharacterized protein (UPF0276 family)
MFLHLKTMMDLSGVGLGLRRDFIDSFLDAKTCPDFIEVAPETMTSRDKLMELFQHTVRVISRVVHQNLASFQEQG